MLDSFIQENLAIHDTMYQAAEERAAKVSDELQGIKFQNVRALILFVVRVHDKLMLGWLIGKVPDSHC